MKVSRFLKCVGIVILLVGIMAASAGCGGSGGEVAGLWKETSSGDVYEFRPDGTLTISMPGLGKIPAKYLTNGGTLTLDIEGFNDRSVASYRVDGDVMKISSKGEQPILLERQRD